MSRIRHVSKIATIAMVGLSMVSTALAAGDGHVMITPDEIEWRGGPASIPEGARAAVLHGDPGEEDLFALRLDLPPDYLIPPHHHPRPEIVTVISGTIHMGKGEDVDRDQGRTLSAGSFFVFPPGEAHYAFTRDEGAVIQLNSRGPWDLVYVDPDDDPRNR